MKTCFSFLLALLAVGAVACTSSSSPSDGVTDDEAAITGTSYECTKPETSGRIGAKSSAIPRVVGARAAGHAGFDRFVIELSGPGATFRVEETKSATFIQDGSGDPITVPGMAGLDVLVRGVDWTSSANVGNFAVGDAKIMTKVTPGTLFEGDLTLGIGLARQACYHVTQLDNPSRLVIDVQNDGAIPTWGADPGTPAFQCGAYPADPSVDAQVRISDPPEGADVATKLVRKTAGAHPDDATPYDRFVLEFEGGEVPPMAWLRPQKTATFSGTGEQEIKLPGAAGIQLTAAGGIETVGTTKVAAAPGTSVFMGATQIENFEGYSEWGIGLSKETCYRAFTLTNPPRVVVDVKR
jgi:hypothetical protein